LEPGIFSRLQGRFFNTHSQENIMAEPVHTIRFGLIKASIWQNHTRAGDRHTVSIVRLYKNGDLWKESTRFGRDDLPLVAKVADLAHSWIFEQANHARRDQATTTPATS